MSSLEDVLDLHKGRADPDLIAAIWALATAAEREACRIICEEVSREQVSGDAQYQAGREMGATVCANRIKDPRRG